MIGKRGRYISDKSMSTTKEGKGNDRISNPLETAW